MKGNTAMLSNDEQLFESNEPEWISKVLAFKDPSQRATARRDFKREIAKFMVKEKVTGTVTDKVYKKMQLWEFQEFMKRKKGWADYEAEGCFQNKWDKNPMEDDEGEDVVEVYVGEEVRKRDANLTRKGTETKEYDQPGRAGPSESVHRDVQSARSGTDAQPPPPGTPAEAPQPGSATEPAGGSAAGAASSAAAASGPAESEEVLSRSGKKKRQRQETEEVLLMKDIRAKKKRVTNHTKEGNGVRGLEAVLQGLLREHNGHARRPKDADALLARWTQVRDQTTTTITKIDGMTSDNRAEVETAIETLEQRFTALATDTNAAVSTLKYLSAQNQEAQRGEYLSSWHQVKKLREACKKDKKFGGYNACEALAQAIVDVEMNPKAKDTLPLLNDVDVDAEAWSTDRHQLWVKEDAEISKMWDELVKGHKEQIDMAVAKSDDFMTKATGTAGSVVQPKFPANATLALGEFPKDAIEKHAWVFTARHFRLRWGQNVPLHGCGGWWVPLTDAMVLLSFDLKALLSKGVLGSDLIGFLNQPAGAAHLRSGAVKVLLVPKGGVAWTPWGHLVMPLYRRGRKGERITGDVWGHLLHTPVLSVDLAVAAGKDACASLSTAVHGHLRADEKRHEMFQKRLALWEAFWPTVTTKLGAAA